MKKLILLTIPFFCILWLSCLDNKDTPIAHEISLSNPWKAQWIVPKGLKDTANVWSVYSKEVEIGSLGKNAWVASIAADSKYWLWVNGNLVVREGQLKRGPTPNSTYFDKVDLTRVLKKGQNTIVALVWHFGKEGFSHKNSGKAGFIFDLQANNMDILSDNTWKAWVHPSFCNTGPPFPNYRLPESNICFDASIEPFNVMLLPNYSSKKPNAIEKGLPPSYPWGELVERPIPLWKDFGLKEYDNTMVFPFFSEGDTIKCTLPYNAQVTPYFEIEAPEAGMKVEIRTDHYFGGGAPNVRTEYITQQGFQQFEDLGWKNGHEVHYHFPKGIKILGLKYRETGYNVNFEGSFSCDVPFYNTLWEKARRTLYVTMRDTYMDCPDRERAQWWGDVVLESGEAFYALGREADLLTKKGIYELLNWQREDSSLYSPVPAGNWDKELPGQMLASVGYYGIYNYFLHTGDTATLRFAYPKIKKYLSLWSIENNGTVAIRQGGWLWGDWGENKDVPLLINTQYYLALKGQYEMAKVLSLENEAQEIQVKMNSFKIAFNQNFWKNAQYRSVGYNGKTDDRAQGLAVIAGLADKAKHGQILKILQEEMHASPYMEKYVLEALFQMGYANVALERMGKRFGAMVNNQKLTTLWEGWGIGTEGFGGGTINHAWSGGGLTLLSQYVAGIQPLTPGYKTFRISPNIAFFKSVNAEVPTIKGVIKLTATQKESGFYSLKLTVPPNSKAYIDIPQTYKKVFLNKKLIKANQLGSKYYQMALTSGYYEITAQ